ncbi:elongation factor Ts, partial [Arthrobacter sp. Hiyo6]
MANYTAADIKALRERTGAGMMDVKKALDEANGDAEKAIEIIRIKGLKGATKREGRSTAEGLVAARVDGGVGVMIEVNCETDFVAKLISSSSSPTRCSPWQLTQALPTSRPCWPPKSMASRCPRLSSKRAPSSVKKSSSAGSHALRAAPLTRTCTRRPKTSRPRSAFCSPLTVKAKQPQRPR